MRNTTTNANYASFIFLVEKRSQTYFYTSFSTKSEFYMQMTKVLILHPVAMGTIFT